VQDAVVYSGCVNAGQCNYQTDLVSMPQVTSSTVSHASNTITLLGTGLTYLTAPYIATGKYAGVEASSVVLTATQAVLNFLKGVPIAQ
jgi:hypothetical protein